MCCIVSSMMVDGLTLQVCLISPVFYYFGSQTLLVEGEGRVWWITYSLCGSLAFQSHELSLQNLNAIGQSLLQISKFRSSTVYSNQNKPITLKNDDIMTKYFFAISRIRNLVGLRGILSLINADGWNAAVDPHKLQVSHQTLPFPSTRRVWEPN